MDKQRIPPYPGVSKLEGAIGSGGLSAAVAGVVVGGLTAAVTRDWSNFKTGAMAAGAVAGLGGGYIGWQRGAAGQAAYEEVATQKEALGDAITRAQHDGVIKEPELTLKRG